jgi:hypothetical protein
LGILGRFGPIELCGRVSGSPKFCFLAFWVYRRLRLAKASTGWHARKFRLSRSNLFAIALSLFSFLVPVLTHPAIEAEAGTLTFAGVQGNANAGLFSNSVPGEILDRGRFGFGKAGNTARKLKPTEPKPEGIIWPENSADLSPLSFTAALPKSSVGNLRKTTYRSFWEPTASINQIRFSTPASTTTRRANWSIFTTSNDRCRSQSMFPIEISW